LARLGPSDEAAHAAVPGPWIIRIGHRGGLVTRRWARGDAPCVGEPPAGNLDFLGADGSVSEHPLELTGRFVTQVEVARADGKVVVQGDVVGSLRNRLAE